MTIELTEEQWRTVLACLAKQPWEVSNGLILAIGGQMQRQAASSQNVPTTAKGNSGDHAEELAGRTRQ